MVSPESQMFQPNNRRPCERPTEDVFETGFLSNGRRPRPGLLESEDSFRRTLDDDCSSTDAVPPFWVGARSDEPQEPPLAQAFPQLNRRFHDLPRNRRPSDLMQ